MQKPKFEDKFRRRFRMPYASFVDLVAGAKESPLFKRWMSHDACGIPSSPIELMLLGSLQYTGRGWTFDNIEEFTPVNDEIPDSSFTFSFIMEALHYLQLM